MINYAILALAVKLWETPLGQMIGDDGNSVGPWQIQKVMVREINRVCHTSYKYDDRLAKGREMFITYARYLHDEKGYGVVQIYQTWNAGDDAVAKGQSILDGMYVKAIYDLLYEKNDVEARRMAKRRGR